MNTVIKDATTLIEKEEITEISLPQGDVLDDKELGINSIQ